MLKFLDAEDIRDIHDEILDHEPGRAGIHLDRLEAVAGRVKNEYVYGQIDDVFNLAAAYCVSIARGHPFVDGNKRTAFTTCMTVLELNGYPVPEQLDTSSDSWADVMVYVAEGRVSREQLATTIMTCYVVGLVGVGVFKLAEWLKKKLT